MDEDKAVKTLTSILAENFEIEVISDKFYKKKLIKGAKHFTQFKEPFVMCFDKFYMKDADPEGRHYRWGFVNTDRTRTESHQVYGSIKEAIEKEEACKGANYFFVDEPTSSAVMNFFVTPYSIIGEKEERELRRLFYKNVPPDVVSAMQTLGVKDYTELYKLYHPNNMEGVFLEEYKAYLKLESILTNLTFENQDNIPQSKVEKLIGMSIKEFNENLPKNVRRLGLYDYYSKSDGCYTTKNGISDAKNEIQAYSPFGKWLSILPDFLDFVFSLPQEDQNIKVNMKIFQLLPEKLDFTGILVKEYSRGKYFQDYFICLDADKQGKVVDSLKTIQKRNPTHDSFLWSRGFKDVGMDYLKLYRENTDLFIEYFSSRGLEEKKIIMKDVMESDFVNEKVISWLNEKETALIREVGLDG